MEVAGYLQRNRELHDAALKGADSSAGAPTFATAAAESDNKE